MEKKVNFADKFKELCQKDVNEFTDVIKQNDVKLTYLSWIYAIREATIADSDFDYAIDMYDGKPYIHDEQTGYLVTTKVTMFNETKPMWLPVMDSFNKAMKSHPYTYKTKYGERTVAAATMFDINTTIMRCLVKNIAMFGIGLYIYAGEDLPEKMLNQEELNKQYQEKLDKAIDALHAAKTIDELLAVWKANKQYQTDSAFVTEKDAMKDCISKQA